MKVSLILEAVDRATAPVKRVEKATQALADRGMKPLERSTARAAAATNRFWNDTARGERIGLRVGSAMRNLASHGFDAVRRSAASAGQATGRMLGHVAKFAAVGAGGAAVAGAAASLKFGRSIIETASQFEQLEVQMTTTMGSAQKAQEAMKFINKFAADTPYETEDVVKAFITAKGQGINPLINGAMLDLGDAASATAKSFEDAANAVGDASRLQFDRLIDFNIVAAQKGGKVALSYIDKTGKAVTKSVSKETLQVQKEVLAIFRELYGGGMVAQSKTLTGIMSNLSDKWTAFKLNVAGRGLYAMVKGDMKDLYDWVQKLQDNGSIDRWAQVTSDWLTTLYKRAHQFVHDVDWSAVAVQVMAVTRNVVELAGWILKITEAVGKWRIDSERSRLNGIINNPTVWQSLFTDRPKAVKDAQGQLSQLDRMQHGEPQVQRRGSAMIWPEGSYRATPRLSIPKAPAKAPGNAKISLHVTTDRGASVEPKKMKASGLDVTFYGGRTMGPFA